MKYLFLVIAVGCLALFIVAGLFVGGEPAPASFTDAPGAFRSQRASGPSLWSIVQNVSAVAGIASFLVQIVQWRRHRQS